MKAANLESSERLMNVYTMLASGQEWSTMDIIKTANVCAVNSIIAELRQNGHNIICQRKGRAWYYKMVF